MRLRLVLAAAIGSYLAMSGLETPAGGALASDGPRKVNMAGRQRMLTQRITKAACYAAIGHDRSAHRKQLETAHQLFDETLEALVNGSSRLGLEPETDARVFHALASVQIVWADFSKAVKRAIAAFDKGAVDADAVQTIYASNVRLLHYANAAVTAIEAKYADGRQEAPDLMAAINTAGRQRMLSQKMSKESCLLVAGYEPKIIRAHLHGTRALFKSAQAQLLAQYKTLAMPDNGLRQRILRKAAEIDTAWTAYETAIAGVKATTADARRGWIDQVAALDDVLLRKLNSAVALLEDVKAQQVRRRADAGSAIGAQDVPRTLAQAAAR